MMMKSKKRFLRFPPVSSYVKTLSPAADPETTGSIRFDLPPVQVVTSESPDVETATTTRTCARATTDDDLQPRYSREQPVAPDSFSGAPIPGLSGHLVVAHVLDKLSDPTDLARVSAVSRGMRDAVAATGRTVMMPSEDEAGKKGYLSTVKHMHSRDRLSDTRLLCAAAATSGSSRS